MPTDLSAIRTSICGSPTLGDYPASDADHARGLVTALAAMKKAAGVTTSLTGTLTPPSYPPVPTIHDDLVQQVTNRWQCHGDGRYRSLPEMWQQIGLDLTALPSDAPAAPALAPPGPTGTVPLPAGTSQGTLTWGADFTAPDVLKAGFLSTPWNTQSGPSWPPSIVAAPDNGERCIEFALPSGGERIEVQPDAAQSIGNGQDCWYGFWFIVDESFVTNTDDWDLIAQFHGNDTTSPHQIIGINGGDLLTSNQPQEHFAKSQIKAGVRYRLVTHISADSGGHQSVWLNDVLVLDNFAAGLNATPLYLKTGVYRRPATFPASTLYQGQHRVGTGYGAVRPR